MIVGLAKYPSIMGFERKYDWLCPQDMKNEIDSIKVIIEIKYFNYFPFY